MVATPVRGHRCEVVRDLLARPSRRPDGVVTDVAGVKGPLVACRRPPAFVGRPSDGRLRAGRGRAAPTADLFVGATWVLTPTAATDLAAFARLQAVVTDLGAEVVALSPEGHDALVAVVSHVPHLTAATLMNLAADRPRSTPPCCAWPPAGSAT